MTSWDWHHETHTGTHTVVLCFSTPYFQQSQSIITPWLQKRRMSDKSHFFLLFFFFFSSFLSFSHSFFFFFLSFFSFFFLFSPKRLYTWVRRSSKCRATKSSCKFVDEPQWNKAAVKKLTTNMIGESATFDVAVSDADGRTPSAFLAAAPFTFGVYLPHTHTRTYTCAHTYTHAHIHTRTRTPPPPHTHTHTPTPTHTPTHPHTQIYRHPQIHWISMYGWFSISTTPDNT